MALFSKTQSAKKSGDAKHPEVPAKNGGAKVKDASGVLVSPHITEKAMRLSEKGAYVFRVQRGATKPRIRQAVERSYNVHVIGVRVVNVSGKAVRLGRSEGRQSHWRKAIVTLKKGETITF